MLWENLFRPLLFLLPPEVAHKVALKLLAFPPISCYRKTLNYPAKVFNLSFPNPIGLAAGFDKNGDYYHALLRLGFGFIELGTVTPLPQIGNPKPRLFRIPEYQALINRLGFNNKGVDHLVAKLAHRPKSAIIGVNIGKGWATPLESAYQDYLICFRKVYPIADYVTVNISSPNTHGLRTLQTEEYLKDLLQYLKEAQLKLAKEYQRYVPLVLKIAPDLTEAEITSIANLLIVFEIDGIIATNTSMSRFDLPSIPSLKETGGLSGRPLKQQSTWVLKKLHQVLQDQIPIIACGGILSPEDAIEKFEAGASLIQLYTGLIYQGPRLIQEIYDQLAKS